MCVCVAQLLYDDAAAMHRGISRIGCWPNSFFTSVHFIIYFFFRIKLRKDKYTCAYRLFILLFFFAEFCKKKMPHRYRGPFLPIFNGFAAVSSTRHWDETLQNINTRKHFTSKKLLPILVLFLNIHSMVYLTNS